MEERALSIGALLAIDSSPGAGTEIRLSVPVPVAASDSEPCLMVE
jgi:nitrate/nitrite-specific signal transduction histidine kinase